MCSYSPQSVCANEALIARNRSQNIEEAVDELMSLVFLPQQSEDDELSGRQSQAGIFYIDMAEDSKHNQCYQNYNRPPTIS